MAGSAPPGSWRKRASRVKLIGTRMRASPMITGLAFAGRILPRLDGALEFPRALSRSFAALAAGERSNASPASFWYFSTVATNSPLVALQSNGRIAALATPSTACA